MYDFVAPRPRVHASLKLNRKDIDREDETKGDPLTSQTYSYNYYGSSHLQQFPYYNCGVTGASHIVGPFPTILLINSESDNEDCVEIQVCFSYL